DLIERNAIHVQPLQATLNGAAQVLRGDVKPCLACLVECDTALGRNDHIAASWAERICEHPLGVAEPIHVGDIKEVDAGVERPSYGGVAFPIVDRTVIVPADGCASESDSRNAETRRTERGVF